MNSHIDRFVEVVKESTNIKGSKWDDLILRFEWTFEADKIRDFIKENKTLTDV
jgi:hypothetical protein